MHATAANLFTALPAELGKFILPLGATLAPESRPRPSLASQTPIGRQPRQTASWMRRHQPPRDRNASKSTSWHPRIPSGRPDARCPRCWPDGAAVSAPPACRPVDLWCSQRCARGLFGCQHPSRWATTQCTSDSNRVLFFRFSSLVVIIQMYICVGIGI